MRDIVFHSQWCAALAMVAVQWPNFVCKLYLLMTSNPQQLKVIIRPFVSADSMVDSILQ